MELIWEPRVFVVGQTTINREGVKDWMLDSGLESVANEDSPLRSMLTTIGEDDLQWMIEFAGRHCYRSWSKGRSRPEYIRNIIEQNHGSVLEHSTVNLAIRGVSRSLSLELVRHRVGIAISQESQRFVDASDMQFVVPPLVAYLAGGAFSNADAIVEFTRECARARDAYVKLQESIVKELLRRNAKTASLTLLRKRANEAARAHLPNAAETRLTWTPNMRLLRHFFTVRGAPAADLEIRRLAVEIFNVVQPLAPDDFYDMKVVEGEFGVPIITNA